MIYEYNMYSKNTFNHYANKGILINIIKTDVRNVCRQQSHGLRHGVVDGRQVDVVVVAVIVAAPLLVLPVSRATAAVIRPGYVIVHVAVAVSLLLQRQSQRFLGRYRCSPAVGRRLFRVVVERPAARGWRQVRVVLGALVPVMRVSRLLLLQVQRPNAATTADVVLLWLRVQVRVVGAVAERRLRVQEPEQRLLGLAYVPRPAAVPAGWTPVVPLAGRRDHAVVQVVVRFGRDHGIRGRHQRLDGRGTAVQPRHGPDARLDRGPDFRSAAVIVHHLLALVLLYGRHAMLGALAAHHRRVDAPLEQLHARAVGRRPALDQLGHLVLQVWHPVRQPHVLRLVRVPRPVRVLGPGPARVQLPFKRGQLRLVGRRPVVHNDHSHQRRRHLQQPVQVVVVLHRQHHLTVHLQKPETDGSRWEHNNYF